jgi:hypothetical protein
VPDDAIEAAALHNMVSWWSSVARARGGEVVETGDQVVVDSHGPNPVVNRSILMRPGLDTATVVRTARAVYDGKPAGPFSIWDPWDALDLSGLGFAESVDLPHMVFDGAGHDPALVVRDARPDELAAAQGLVQGAFDFVPWDDSEVLSASLLDGRTRVFVVDDDGAPAATALAHDAGGVTGVYLVATGKGSRGKGLGEAASWAATLAFPGQPAVLQASRMGYPVYERMGYRTFGTIRVWFSPRA